MFPEAESKVPGTIGSIALLALASCYQPFFPSGVRCREVVDSSLVLENAPILVDRPPRLCHEIVLLSLSSVAYHSVSSIFHLHSIQNMSPGVEMQLVSVSVAQAFRGPFEATIGNQHEQLLVIIRVRILAPWLKHIRNP